MHMTICYQHVKRTSIERNLKFVEDDSDFSNRIMNSLLTRKLLSLTYNNWIVKKLIFANLFYLKNIDLFNYNFLNP